MNLGKRIKQRLDELGWERNDLLNLVPDLTPSRLSALIKRDSKRCELDYQIATALGVTLHWLNSEVPPKFAPQNRVISIATAQADGSIGTAPTPPSPLMVAATRLDRAAHVSPAVKASITELLKSLVLSTPPPKP